MADTTTAKFWIAVDSAGNFCIDIENAEDAASGMGTGTIETAHVRVFEMNLTLPLPKATSVSATVPDTDGAVTITVA